MNTHDVQPTGTGPLTGIIKFLAIVGILTIFFAGVAIGMLILSLLLA